MPQLEDGYTRIANELIDAISAIRVPGEAMQIFWFIVRKTYGFNKKFDAIALSQFLAATGLKKPNVCRALKKLADLNMVIIKKDKDITEYAIQKHYKEWRPLSKKITLLKKITNIIKKDNLPLSKKIHTKDTLTKDKKHSSLFDESELPKDVLPKSKKPAKDKPAKLNAWGAWVDINREFDRPDPVPIGPDLKAAQGIAKHVEDIDHLKELYRLYLSDEDNFLTRQGHPLRLMTGRINKYMAEEQEGYLSESAYEAECKRIDEAEAQAQNELRNRARLNGNNQAG